MCEKYKDIITELRFEFRALKGDEEEMREGGDAGAEWEQTEKASKRRKRKDLSCQRSHLRNSMATLRTGYNSGGNFVR